MNNFFKDGELDESLVCAKFAHTKDYGRRKGAYSGASPFNIPEVHPASEKVKQSRWKSS